jgi:hypothetical protein
VEIRVFRSFCLFFYLLFNPCTVPCIITGVWREDKRHKKYSYKKKVVNYWSQATQLREIIQGLRASVLKINNWCTPVIFSSYTCYLLIILLLSSHHTPVIFSSYSCYLLIILLLSSHHTPVIFSSYSCYLLIILLLSSHHTPVIFSYDEKITGVWREGNRSMMRRLQEYGEKITGVWWEDNRSMKRR